MRRRSVHWLLAILVLAAALRVFHLGTESLWVDEAFSIAIARDSLSRIVSETAADVHPPLYYFALFFWERVAGSSEAAARLLSAIASLVTIVSAYFVSRRLAGEHVALATALVLAVSPFHIEFAQEARMYALLGLLSTLSMQTFLAMADWPKSRVATAPVWLAYTVSTTAMLYTHAYGAFIPVAQAVILGWLWRHDRARFDRVFRPWIGALVIGGLCLVPWLAAFADQMSRVSRGFWLPPPAWYTPLHPLLVFAGSIPLVCVVPFVAIFGAAALRRGDPRDHSERVLPPLAVIGPWFIVPLAVPILLSLVMSPIFQPKYAIAASVPFAMCVAAGLVSIPNVTWRRSVAATLVALSTLSLVIYYSRPRKDGWREIVASLEARARPNDVVLLYPDFDVWVFDFYRQRQDLVMRPFPYFKYDAPPPADSLPVLAKAAIGADRRVWLIVLQNIKAGPSLAAGLADVLPQVEHVTARNLSLFLYERQTVDEPIRP